MSVFSGELPNHSSHRVKKSSDVKELAEAAPQAAPRPEPVGQADGRNAIEADPDVGKDRKAIELGRRGGLKGGAGSALSPG